jgi:hypothetical protein
VVLFEVSVLTVSRLEIAQKGRGTGGAGSGEETNSSRELGAWRLEPAVVVAGRPEEGDDKLGWGGP